jgi:hypothetical protein
MLNDIPLNRRCGGEEEAYLYLDPKISPAAEPVGGLTARSRHA